MSEEKLVALHLRQALLHYKLMREDLAGCAQSLDKAEKTLVEAFLDIPTAIRSTPQFFKEVREYGVPTKILLEIIPE